MMKKRLFILLTTLLFACSMSYGQFSFKCKSWERCRMDDNLDLVDCGDEVIETSMFDVNEAETMIVHTTSDTKTAYYVKSSEPMDSGFTFKVKSDTGNDYILIFLPSDMEVLLLFSDDEDTYVVMFMVDKIYMEEPEVPEVQLDPQECYDKGNEYYDKQDYAEAVNWYRKAAELGHAKAQNDLGWCYQKGLGVTQNSYEAANWYRKSADQGYSVAQNNTGFMYECGYGVTQNYFEAAKWYRKAADQGYATAQSNLARCYQKGNGVTQSYYEAVNWFRKAADQNYATAEYYLGNAYYDGYGVVQSYTEAKKWYQLAADQGDSYAIKAMDRLNGY